MRCSSLSVRASGLRPGEQAHGAAPLSQAPFARSAAAASAHERPPALAAKHQVELAGERVQRELEEAFLPLLAAHQAAGEAAKLRPSIAFDSANNALWVKIPKNSGRALRGG